MRLISKLTQTASLLIVGFWTLPAQAYGEVETNIAPEKQGIPASILDELAPALTTNDAENDTAEVASINGTPASQAFYAYSFAQRTYIQRRLWSMGYYYGPIDGTFGTATYNAVFAYARDYKVLKGLRSMRGALAIYDSLLR